MSKSRLLPLALVAIFLAFTGCSDNGPTEPEANLRLDGAPSASVVEEPTAKDLEFRDELRAGYFTICKVADGEMQFEFQIQAEGPGVPTAPLYVQNVTLGGDECADVYQAPEGTGIDADLVTMTEVVPEGWQIDRIAVWSLDEVEPGVFETTFHTVQPPTPTVSGSIDAGKQGCVVIYYNSEIPDEPGECPRSPGYWKTHPEAWPVDELTIGGETFSKAEALEILWQPDRGDKTKTLFRALVAAKLNMYNDVDTDCVESEMAAADEWFDEYGVCTNVRGNSHAWMDGEMLYETLNDYNNGRLCGGPCPDDDDRDGDDYGSATPMPKSR